MTAEQVNPAEVETDNASPSETERRVERVLTDAAKVAERVFRQQLNGIRARTEVYSGDPVQTVEDARRYLADRIKERPMTATLAGLGVGFLFGLMFAGRDR